MLMKDLKEYLLSECANCACHLNKEDRIKEPTLMITGENLSEKNYHIDAVSYIYKIPPEELIANVRSHFIQQSGESSTEFGDVISDERSKINFAFCKTCAPMFGKMFRSHQIFHLWSSAGNIMSKAIQPFNHLKINNTIENKTDNSEVNIKSEIEDSETDSTEEIEKDNNNFVYVDPSNQYDNICGDENDPLSEDVKCEIDPIDLENDEGDCNSFSEVLSNFASKNCADAQTHQTLPMKLKESKKVESSSKSVNPPRPKIVSDPDKIFIKGPPYHCPLCPKMPPFKFPNGIRLHCEAEHKLVLPAEIFNKGVVKESDIFETHQTFIKGPPYQCPSCVESFKMRQKFDEHCKCIHRLIIPRQLKRTAAIVFSCCFCKKDFKKILAWKNHCRIAHNCRFVCVVCKIGFGTNDDLQAHLKIDCGPNKSLSKTMSTLPSVDPTEEHSMLDVNAGKRGANITHPAQQVFDDRESVPIVSMKTNAPFLFFPTKKSKTPPFECPMAGCNKNFAQMPLLEDHCQLAHQSVLKVKTTPLPIYFCDECTECAYGKEEFTEHLKAAHYEKFFNCPQPSGDAHDPSADCEKSRLKCNICELTFEHYNLLQQHSVESHSISLKSYEKRFFNFICRGCDTLFETSLGLRGHTLQCGKKNNGAKVFSCKYCSTTVNSIQELTTHMENVHGIKTPNSNPKRTDPKIPKCLFCLKVFNSQRDLQYHKLLIRANSNNSADNSETSSVTCQICNARFASSGGWKIHQLTKHPEEALYSNQGPFNCDVCNKSFPKQRSLNSHIISAHIKLKKKCKICGEKFFKYSYIRHVRLAHTGYKRYKCTFCDKTFIEHSELKAHEALKHSEASPFVCSICGRGFKLRMNMKYHERTHNTEKGFICERCGIALKSKLTYNLHMRNHKQDDLAGPNPKCSECNKAFSNGNQLRHHKRISHNKHGPLPCPICGKTFALKERVTSHIRVMHPENL